MEKHTCKSGKKKFMNTGESYILFLSITIIIIWCFWSKYYHQTEESSEWSPVCVHRVIFFRLFVCMWYLSICLCDSCLISSTSSSSSNKLRANFTFHLYGPLDWLDFLLSDLPCLDSSRQPKKKSKKKPNINQTKLFINIPPRCIIIINFDDVDDEPHELSFQRFSFFRFWRPRKCVEEKKKKLLGLTFHHSMFDWMVVVENEKPGEMKKNYEKNDDVEVTKWYVQKDMNKGKSFVSFFSKKSFLFSFTVYVWCVHSIHFLFRALSVWWEKSRKTSKDSTINEEEVHDNRCFGFGFFFFVFLSPVCVNQDDEEEEKFKKNRLRFLRLFV